MNGTHLKAPEDGTGQVKGGQTLGSGLHDALAAPPWWSGVSSEGAAGSSWCPMCGVRVYPQQSCIHSPAHETRGRYKVK